MKSIFSQPLQKYELHKMTEEIRKNPDYVINKDNVQEFFDCNYILEILRDNNIEYQIKLEEKEIWRSGTRSALVKDYIIQLIILISDEDYEKIKKDIEAEETPKELQEIEGDEEEHYKVDIDIRILMCFIFFLIAGSLFGLGIYLLTNEKYQNSIDDVTGEAYFMLILGGVVGIWLLMKIIKLLKDRKDKKIRLL